MNIQRIASDVLGNIVWKDEFNGYVECPGKHLHHGKNSNRDCKVYLNGAPTVHCFHQSCFGILENVNLQLRRKAGGHLDGETRIWTEEEKQAVRRSMEERKKKEYLENLSLNSFDVIFNKYKWNPEEAWEESPLSLVGEPEQDWQLFLGLFKPEDVLWNGAVIDSGSEKNKENFKPRDEWRKFQPKQFICSSVFRSGVYSRSNENVLSRPYLPIESDELTKSQICCVFKFCMQFMELKAIIDTAGKSLHGWFVHPSKEILEELTIILPILKCDKALFKPSQPVRAPGALRGSLYQSLIYLKQ